MRMLRPVGSLAFFAVLGFGVVMPRAVAQSGTASLAGRFQFSLKTKGTTSAGVFDRSGRLVRPLWSLRPLEAGRHSDSWDDRDQFGTRVPRGEYEVRIVVNN